MLTESDRHLAAQAVSRFGADRGRVFEILAAVHRAQVAGRQADFLNALVEQKLITSGQAKQLRFALDDTHIDPELNLLTPRPQPAPGLENGAVPRDAEDLIGPATGLEVRTVGPYRILASLGEGGMGAVYRAYHPVENRYVAIKVLADHLALNQSYLERFHREAQNVARLNHPNIVRSLGAGWDKTSGKHYLVLEFVDGETAQELCERLGRLKVSDAVHIILDIARALEHAHSRRIIHRDIKPDNILLTRTGVAKLGDLGLAKQEGEASSLTATGRGFGTPFYMPVEQAYSARSADARSDIFALGATLYHLVTGQVPFPGESAVAIVEQKRTGKFVPASGLCPDVPPVLDRILAKMMARHPRDRYQTVCELIVDLERSKLAAPVPSFADEELALRDPLVRARLTAPAQPTQPDLSLPRKSSEKANGADKHWYLRIPNRSGQTVKARMAEEEIRERLASGRLKATMEAARESHGDFRPLSAYPEFQVAGAAPAPKPADLPEPPPADQPEPPVRGDLFGTYKRQWLAALLAALILASTWLCWVILSS